ncbi:uncharacterized protein LOC110634912 [Hevea brasiliensis]|uniref:uncharacterized protein LOC110634912 n=1 Tax=Hevea brasiliensis TaxID=3981 RepID=UPI000B76CAAC|nr:uncharacterized protein LOC110634912 [Hevea brasiliensis]
MAKTKGAITLGIQNTVQQKAFESSSKFSSWQSHAKAGHFSRVGLSKFSWRWINDKTWDQGNQGVMMPLGDPRLQLEWAFLESKKPKPKLVEVLSSLEANFLSSCEQYTSLLQIFNYLIAFAAFVYALNTSLLQIFNYPIAFAAFVYALNKVKLMFLRLKDSFSHTLKIPDVLEEFFFSPVCIRRHLQLDELSIIGLSILGRHLLFMSKSCFSLPLLLCVRGCFKD